MKYNKLYCIMMCTLYIPLCYSMEPDHNLIELKEVIIDQSKPNTEELFYKLKKYSFMKKKKKREIILNTINNLPRKQSKMIKNKFNLWWYKIKVGDRVHKAKRYIKKVLGILLFAKLINFLSGVTLIKGAVTPSIVLYTGSWLVFFIALHQLHWSHYQVYKVQHETHALKRIQF